MYRVIRSTDDVQSENIMCMANLRGNHVRIPGPLPFSFYFSAKSDKMRHGIRVKPVFNPARMTEDATGVLELHGEYNYTPGPNDDPSSKEIKYMKNFFKKYKVLFAAVWEHQLDEADVQDFFRNLISFEDLVQSMNQYEDYKADFNKIHDISALEDFVRKNSLFNMND